ncbi:MAG: sigma-70 family RNA polymerase sigma factor [Eubacteriales bacterium]
MSESKKFDNNPQLLALSRGGDESATESLIKNNAGLVNSIAVRFVGRGTDLEDLIQIGNIGLLKAIRTFDPGRECAFSTYAVPLIFGEIRRFLRDDGPVKISRTQKRLGARLTAERERAAAQGQELRIEELARRCEVSPAEAAAAMEATAPLRSLSDYLYGDEEGPTVESAVCDEEESERNLMRLALTSAIDKLPDIRKKIIMLRYYKDLSQQQTADLLGLTQVKVSREEKKILAFLQQELS